MTTPLRHVVSDSLFKMPSTSHAVCADGIVFVSGLLGTVGNTLNLAGDGAARQTTQALRNLEHVLQLCGARLDDLLKVTVILTNPDHFLDMDRAYAQIVRTRPARIALYCAALPLDAAVELDAIARLPSR